MSKMIRIVKCQQSLLIIKQIVSNSEDDTHSDSYSHFLIAAIFIDTILNSGNALAFPVRSW